MAAAFSMASCWLLIGDPLNLTPSGNVMMQLNAPGYNITKFLCHHL